MIPSIYRNTAAWPWNLHHYSRNTQDETQSHWFLDDWLQGWRLWKLQSVPQEVRSHQGMDTCFLRANTLGDISRVTSRQVSISSDCSVTNPSQTFLDNLQNGRIRGPFLRVQTSDYEEDAYIWFHPILASVEGWHHKTATEKASQIFPFLKASQWLWWLDRNGPHRLTLVIGSSTIRKCDLVRVGVAMCTTRGCALRSQKPQATPSVAFSPCCLQIQI